MNETIFENIGFFLNQEDLKIGASEPVSFGEDEHFQLDVIDLPLHFKCDAEKDGIVCRLYQRVSSASAKKTRSRPVRQILRARQ